MGAEGYLQARTGTAFISFFKLFINVILALSTSYATGTRLFTNIPFLGGGVGVLGFPFDFFILSLAARLSSRIGIGKGFLSFFE